MNDRVGGSPRISFGRQPVFAAPQFSELHRVCFGAHNRTWSAAEFDAFRRDASVGWAEAVLPPSTSNEAVLLGFALIRVILDEAELLTLCCHPNWSGQGLGKALVERVITEAAGCGAATMFLEVSKRNRTARNLYGTLGFQEVGNRRGYYRNDAGISDDALVLRTELGSR